jgi:multidrug resistance efflux pump
MLARNKKLFEKKDVSTSTLDSTFFSTERATRSAEQAQLEEHRLLAEKDGLLTKNVFINQDGRSEVTYQDQRIHEIRIRLEEIHSRTGEQEVRLSAINKRIDLETARLSGFESREIRAPSYSVIQKSYVIEGTHVDAKTKVVDIIDCTKVFMDMTIHDGYFQKIKVGERVTIQLRGVSKKLHGTVAHLRGGTLFAEPEKDIAGVAPLRKPYEMQVLIHIDPEDLYNTAADYCHVGHTGEVSFDGMRVVK